MARQDRIINIVKIVPTILSNLSPKATIVKAIAFQEELIQIKDSRGPGFECNA